MTDLSTYVMLDDVNLALLGLHAPAAHALAGYVNGDYANYAELAKASTSAGKFLLSIDVNADTNTGAQCLDIENGDATAADAPAWFKATAAAGAKARDFRWFPKLYTSESNLPALVKVMTKAKIPRASYLLWSAHYTDKAHICGPSSCGSKVQADATQWTDRAFGVSLDESLCSAQFFAGPPALPKPVTAPLPVAVAAPAAPKPAVLAVSVDGKGAHLSDGSVVAWS